MPGKFGSWCGWKLYKKGESLAAIQVFLFGFTVHTSGINIKENGFLNVTVLNLISIV